MNSDVHVLPILVADDNATDLFFLQRRLGLAGIANPVHHVADGVDAVAFLERATQPGADRPFLMFVDLKMPRMDGFEVMRWMRERRLMDLISVVVLTTSDEPRDVEHATDLGAVRFLVKYPRPAELRDVFDAALRRLGSVEQSS